MPSFTCLLDYFTDLVYRYYLVHTRGSAAVYLFMCAEYSKKLLNQVHPWFMNSYLTHVILHRRHIGERTSSEVVYVLTGAQWVADSIMLRQ